MYEGFDAMNYEGKVFLAAIVFIFFAYSIRNYAYKMDSKTLHQCIDVRLDAGLDKNYREAHRVCKRIWK